MPANLRELLETAEEAAQELVDDWAAKKRLPHAAELPEVAAREAKRVVGTMLEDAPSCSAKDRAGLEKRFASVLLREGKAQLKLQKAVDAAPIQGDVVRFSLVSRGPDAKEYKALRARWDARAASLEKLGRGRRTSQTVQFKKAMVAFVIDNLDLKGDLAVTDGKKARALQAVKLERGSYRLALSPDETVCFYQSKKDVYSVEVKTGAKKKLSLPPGCELLGALSAAEVLVERNEALEWWSLAGKKPCALATLAKLSNLSVRDYDVRALPDGGVLLAGKKALAIVARRENDVIRLAQFPLANALPQVESTDDGLFVRSRDVVLAVTGLSGVTGGRAITNCAAAFSK